MKNIISILFKKKYWNKKKINGFLKNGGYKKIKQYTTKNYFRIRLIDSKKFNNFITIPSKKYKTVKYVIGIKIKKNKK